LIKNKIKDVWRIGSTVNVGDTVVSITSSSTQLNLSETFSISHPSGDFTETFRVTSASGRQLTIDTDPYTVGNQGFLLPHAKTNDDATSHSITAQHTIGGLSPIALRDQPALVVGATESDVGQVFAHELMHDQDLKDVDEIGNIMYYSKKSISDKPFVYKPVNVVITGTPTRTGAQQNQWETISR
jgi:hypothetical protein